MRVSVVVALLVLGAAALLLGACSTAGESALGTGDDSETTAVIDPAVLEALEEQDEVEVLISLIRPDLPIEDQTTGLMRDHTAAVQESVLAALAPSDFTLLRQLDIVPAMSGRITESGVKTLAAHPDVLRVALNCCLFVPGRETP